MPAFMTYRTRPIDLVTEWKRERRLTNFDSSVHSLLPHPMQSSPATESAVITYFFKFIHQTTPPFIPALVTNLIYYSSSSN